MELKTQVNQKMTLSAHMQQCLEILAMDNVELGEFLAEQSMENPVMELSDTAVWTQYTPAMVHVEREQPEDEEETGREIAASESANSDLYFQLSEYRLAPDVRKAAEYIIESLDGRGYFTDGIAESAQVLGLESGAVEKALEVVKQLEPKGIGASDLKECLLLQLASEYPQEETAREILEHYLDDFSKGRYEKISKKTGKPKTQIMEAGDIIRRLDPKPFGGGRLPVRTRYLSADLALVMYGDSFDIVLNQTYLPEIGVSRLYVDMLSGDVDEQTKQYIRERYEKAKWIRECVQKRQRTLLRIAELVFRDQTEFLACGPSGIRPLTLKEAANELKLSSSTVSRAVRGKYIQTRWGIYPLKAFFGGGIRTEEGTVSAAQVRAVIGRMIEKEDKAHPLSDSKLATMLKERGMRVSRRTVAAYRERLGIPASAVRRAEHFYKGDGGGLDGAAH